MRIVPAFVLVAALAAALPANAATIAGVVSDATGAALPSAHVVVRDIATGRELSGDTDGEGRYTIATPVAGTYLVIVTRAGFSEAARTIVVDNVETVVDLPVQLELGVMTAQVSVTANRAERESRQIPLHVETMPEAAIEQQNPLSTGDVLTTAPNVTPVGNGPFGVRPRLRGLDSTRLLVLVDGERLNTARQATDRTGAEVGLISTDAIKSVEMVNGAGTLMYGSDALAGTINIITNEPGFSAKPELLYGFNGYYSSNENGMRGTATLGVSSPRATLRVQGGAENYDNYKAGKFDVEDTRPYFASGQLNRADTIDDNFGFNFNAFPEPFNAPYVRTDEEIPNSQAKGNFVNASSLIKVGDRRTVRVKYQRRRMTDIGYPDFADPYFFNATAVPKNNLDKISARYEAQAVTPWLANLSLTAHYQKTDRLLQTTLPVQFPAPAATFFPISVFRLDILSETAAARVEPRRRPAGRVRARRESRADDGPDLLPRSQQRRAHDDHADVDGGRGGARPAGPGAAGVPVAREARAAHDRASRARARREPAGRGGVRGRRVAREAQPVGDGGPARRFLRREDGSHARLRRGLGRRRAPSRRSIPRRCPTPTAPTTTARR